MQAAVCEAICGEAACAALGAPNAEALQLRLVNLAAAAEVRSKLLVAEQSEAEAEHRSAAQQADRQLTQVQRPAPREVRQSPVRQVPQHALPPPLAAAAEHKHENGYH